MPADYDGVNVRTLTDTERSMRTGCKEIPLVIEPKSSTGTAFLNEFLRSHSDRILKDIARVGAVLLRGFDVRTDVDFEKAVLSVRGLRGMNDALMSEPGRTLVEGTEFILHTNALYKTGATLVFGGFHAENYYSPDVPRYIAFCCHKPARLGGETGLVYMPGVYGELDEAIRKKLEDHTFRAITWGVAAVAQRYSVPPEAVETLCSNVGLPLDTRDNRRVMHLYKPSVFEFRQTKQATLVLNESNEIPGLNEALFQRFAPDYAGWRWTVWRLARRYPFLMHMEMSGNRIRALKRSWARRKSPPRAKTPLPDQVGSIFTAQDVEHLADAMWRNFTTFPWKRGDIVLVDNLQMAHGGMPGRGARLVRAMICNPVPMSYSPDAPGRYPYTDADDRYQTLVDRISRL